MHYGQHLKHLGALWIAMVALGCGGTEPTTGTYDLVSVNGEPLPFVESGSLFTFETLSATLTLDDDYSEAQEVRTTRHSTGGVSTSVRVFSGAYGVVGSAITIQRNQNGQNLTGTLEGGVLTFTAGDTYRYERR